MLIISVFTVLLLDIVIFTINVIFQVTTIVDKNFNIAIPIYDITFLSNTGEVGIYREGVASPSQLSD